MAEVESRTDTSEASLIDVDGPHIETVQPDFASQPIKTETQAAQHEREYIDVQRSESSNNQDKGKRSKTVSKAGRNADNPVFIGNAVVTAALAGVLGWSGYRWYQNGAKGGFGVIAGAIAAVGIFGAGDYFASRWLLSKYPPRN